MTISKFTTNLYASEVYRELERNAVKKGFFKPTETETVKLAAEQISIDKEINKPIDTATSGDLVQDVSKLAYALRRKGFIAQAEEIESSLVSYAQAEKSLYDVKIEKCENDFDKEKVLFPGNELGTVETPETMAKKILEVVNKEPTVKTAGYPYGVTSESMNEIIGFAHRDGDADLVGFGEQGVFETIHSIADKILEVAYKQPTGKLPFEKMAAFVKGAQDSGKSKYEILKSINDAGKQFESMKNSPPSYDELYFTNLSDPAQIKAYVYFAGQSGISVNPNAIGAWFKVKGAAKNTGVLIEGNVPSVSAEAMYKRFQRSSVGWGDNKDWFMYIANSISPEVGGQANNYFNENSPLYILSGGFEVGLNNDKTWAACQWLAGQCASLYNSAFGQNNSSLAKAQEFVINYIASVYNRIASIKPIENTVIINEGISNLANISRELDKTRAMIATQPMYAHLSSLNSSVISSIIKWIDSMKSIVSSAYSEGSSSGQVVNIDTSQLNNAVEYWLTQAQTEGNDRAKMMAINTNIIKEIIETYNGKPWAEMKAALKERGIDESSEQSFRNSINAIVSSAGGK